MSRPHEERVLQMPELIFLILQHAIAEHTEQRFWKTEQHPIDLLPVCPEDRTPGNMPKTAGAAYLQVNRQWCKSGRCSLYHTVVLSRHVQVLSLAEALQKPEPRLGRYIRVLVLYNSIEFGDPLEEIFRQTSNLHTLSLSINFPKNRFPVITALLDSLPTITPRGLIIRDVPPVKRTKYCNWQPKGGPDLVELPRSDDEERDLVEKLSECIKKEWKDSLV
ncbi:hypothetical protein R3P38DRAFT_3200322 [Favolaschia claudopus]|uniref:Uncharacterized protein n=1 Tax=Favolaschia claudopus TaxID=2862362 RepID=A0AAW0B1Z9_9AGAR